ncbi:hypothetical protein IFR04_003788 [Cadophora malorum]|uniref:Uncharacterized protein n=1 Tax=Cadophora malorum TaxID=108018 RepID=A0A8H7WDX5_9HELO|nr:hypothetical protein IFR04_003788 [Cadophora malorum]
MKPTTLFTNIIGTTILILSATGLAVPRTSSDYPVRSLSVTGTTGNGIPLNHTGTIEEILSQISTKNPDFEIPVISKVIERAVGRRNDANQDKLLCIPVPGQNWEYACEYDIDDGIKYLDSLKNAICWVQPFSCTRVSCAHNNAIYM